MDGRRPRGMMFAPTGADPAWPVGGANMSEPQDAASESTHQTAMPGHGWPAPEGMMFAPSGADPAWPVGGANMSEPQDAASESNVSEPSGSFTAPVAPPPQLVLIAQRLLPAKQEEAGKETQGQ